MKMESTHEALWSDKKNVNEKIDTNVLHLLLTLSSVVVRWLAMVNLLHKIKTRKFKPP